MEMVLENGTVVINTSNLRFNTTFRLATLRAGMQKEKERYDNSELTIDRLLFDSKEGMWNIQYHEFGSSKCKKYPLGRITRVTGKHDGLGKKDASLFCILKKFDADYGSSYATSYLAGDFKENITYNNANLFKNESYSLRDKIDIFRNAIRQRKYKNVDVINPGSTAIVSTILFATVALTAFCGVISGISKRTRPTNNNKPVVEQQLTTIVDDNTTEVAKTIEKAATTEAVIAKKKDTSTTNNTVKKEKETISTPKVEETVKNREFKLNSKYKLDNVELHRSAIGNSKSRNTNSLKCDYYKMSLITVVSNNTILELESVADMKNEELSSVISNYKKEYGEDASIFVTFNGYSKDNEKYADIGWVNVKDINVVETSKNKDKVENLKKLRRSLTKTAKQYTKTRK